MATRAVVEEGTDPGESDRQTVTGLFCSRPEWNIHSDSDLRKNKKCVLIDFWSSWCGPCRREIPNLKKIYEAYVDKGLEIISISIDKEDKAWQKALDEEQLPWPNLIDRQELFGEQFYGRTIPAIFLVTEDGIVQYVTRGQALSDKIAEILN